MPQVDKSCGGGKPGAETREKWNSLGSSQEEASAWAGLIGQLNDWFIMRLCLIPEGKSFNPEGAGRTTGRQMALWFWENRRVPWWSLLVA